MRLVCTPCVDSPRAAIPDPPLPFLSCVQTDVKTLVERFDMNKDGKISMEEFVTFTLNIPHLAWRAEKGRRKSLGSTSNLNNPTPALPLEGTQALQVRRFER